MFCASGIFVSPPAKIVPHFLKFTHTIFWFFVRGLRYLPNYSIPLRINAEESTEEGTEQHNSVAPASYTLKGTCDGTPFQVVLTRFGHGGINGDYKNLDSGTKMKLDGTWEGGDLEFKGRIQNVRYEFKLHSNENAPRALQTYYSGSLDIIWSGGQKYRDVDLTIVSKE